MPTIKLVCMALLECYTKNDWVALNSLLWLYHKYAAKQQGIDTSAPQWFVKLISFHPQCELQRTAVDILSEQQKAGLPVGVPEFLSEELKTLIEKIKSFISSK